MSGHTAGQQDRYPNETLDSLRDVLLRNGFVRCDIAACNCGSWHHRYGLRQRFDDFKAALTEAGHPPCNDNGNLPIRALAELVKERDAMRLALDLMCAGVAELHAHNAGQVTLLMMDNFGGEFFTISDTWTATINAIGWQRCVEALAAARGS